jgi:hypothetical protein
MWVKIKKKLGIMKRYLGRSALIGFVAAFVSTLWIALGGTIYQAVWINELIILDFFLLWLIWSLVLSVVVPAVSCDEFTT